MPVPPFTQLGGRFLIEAHQHVAALYRGSEGAFRFASFLAEGLERGDVCLYLATSELHAEMLARLARDFPAIKERQLNSHLRLDSGVADFATMRERTKRLFHDAEDRRAPGVRWLEDGAWAEVADFPHQRFCEFHAHLNLQVKHYPSVALCQYALDSLEPMQLFACIAVHRHLIVDDVFVRDNPFYIPAENFVPLSEAERARNLTQLFREVGFDLEKLLAALAGYGRLAKQP